MTHKNIIKERKKTNLRQLLNNRLRKDGKSKSFTSITNVETQKNKKKIY